MERLSKSQQQFALLGDTRAEQCFDAGKASATTIFQTELYLLISKVRRCHDVCSYIRALQHSISAGITQARVSPGLSLFKTLTSPRQVRSWARSHSPWRSRDHISQLSLNICSPFEHQAKPAWDPPLTSKQWATLLSWISDKDYPCSQCVPHHDVSKLGQSLL